MAASEILDARKRVPPEGHASACPVQPTRIKGKKMHQEHRDREIGKINEAEDGDLQAGHRQPGDHTRR